MHHIWEGYVYASLGLGKHCMKTAITSSDDMILEGI